MYEGATFFSLRTLILPFPHHARISSGKFPDIFPALIDTISHVAIIMSCTTVLPDNNGNVLQQHKTDINVNNTNAINQSNN